MRLSREGQSLTRKLLGTVGWTKVVRKMRLKLTSGYLSWRHRIHARKGRRVILRCWFEDATWIVFGVFAVLLLTILVHWVHIGGS